MADAILKTSLEGKIRNLKDFKSEALLPLFEAIANSIQAIEEKDIPISQGEITVRIKRDNRQVNLNLDGDDALGNINGFEIEDNGVGFNDNNFDSFQTAESTYKLKVGGKGIGRFLWLKAFHQVEVESVYLGDDGHNYQRDIKFTIAEGVKELRREPVVNNKTGSNVKLNGFDEAYRKSSSAYKTTEKIAQRIFEHCLTKYISGLAPSIKVVDVSVDKSINLSEFYKEIQDNISTENFTVNEHNFTIHHIRLYQTRSQTHQLVYCAHGRDVKKRSIGTLLGTSIQFDDSGKKFFYSAYITSQFLDDSVDQYRQEFNIPESTDLVSQGGVTMELIELETMKSVRNYLSEVIASVENQKSERIANYVQNESPMLRAVIKYFPEAAKEIELNTPDEKMAQILYSYKGKAEYEIKKNSEKLLRTQATSISEIETEYQELAVKLEDFQKDQLAGYVIFRKMIIDLLEKKLELNAEGKYHNEDIVHDIVFPRKTDSNHIAYENHNLWLIDELLAFHSIASSDNKLSDMSQQATDERPDIVVFSEVDEERRARAISIIEFKKPQRTNFDEDPTKQLFRYVREIRNKGVWLSNGRQVTVDDTSRFYCYAICDITNQIKEFAENGNYAPLQGGYGFYTYNRNHNAHVEIVAFDKIVMDSKKRHKAFFEHLGILK